MGGRPLKLRWRYPEKQRMRGEDCNPSGGPRGGRLMESWGPVAVVLIDQAICRALSVQLGDAQVKYWRINHVGRMAGGSRAAQRP